MFKNYLPPCLIFRHCPDPRRKHLRTRRCPHYLDRCLVCKRSCPKCNDNSS